MGCECDTKRNEHGGNHQRGEEETKLHTFHPQLLYYTILIYNLSIVCKNYSYIRKDS